MSTPVEEIKSRLDIVDFINEYVKLTPGGANWKARCPFHHEKSPSFMVSRSKGIWHCFGCGKGGDVFAFLMEMEGLEFVEALRVLAKRANVTLEPRDPKIASQRNLLLDIMKEAVEFAHQFLLRDTKAQVAREYLQKRGVEEQTIDLFRLGYTPPEWETLLRHLRDKGYREPDIFQAGLTVKRPSGTGSYDRFRGRVLFPIDDIHGNPIGFGARQLVTGEPGAEDTGAKYINTPQTPIYDKSSVLYGIDRARQEMKRQNVAVVVEGYMDCIASHQAGVLNVVASSGTALTEQQVRLLKRFAPTLILSFDADAAGQEAAKRGVAQALAQELTVKILELPKGKDPDELIQQDVELWKKAITDAKPALEYFFDATFRKLDLTKVDDKKAAAKELLPFIGSALDPVEQAHYLKLLANKLGVEENLLRERLPKKEGTQGSGRRVQTEAKPAAARVERDRTSLLSEQLVALLFRYPEELPFVAEQLSPSALSDEGAKRLYTEAIVWYTEHQQFDPAQFRAAYASDAELFRLMDVAALLADKEFPEDNGLEVRRELTAIIHPLKLHDVQFRLSGVTKRIQDLEATKTKGEPLDTALKEFHELTDELNRLG